MLLPAPGLSSTTMDCPSCLPMSAATTRASTSPAAPAVKPTMSRIGFEGYSSAPADASPAPASSAQPTRAQASTKRAINPCTAQSFQRKLSLSGETTDGDAECVAGRCDDG